MVRKFCVAKKNKHSAVVDCPLHIEVNLFIRVCPWAMQNTEKQQQPKPKQEKSGEKTLKTETKLTNQN